MSTAPRRQTAGIVLRAVSNGLLLGGGAFALAGVAVTHWLWIPAAALAVGAGVVRIVRAGILGHPGRVDPSRTYIGAGADVDASARIEPGAVIEMGATVEGNAIIESGAVVRMGATVHRDATLRGGAVVGWGATVQGGALVETNASVGAGATLGQGAVLPAGRHLAAGATLRATRETKRDTPVVALADPRAEQFNTLCNRLEVELQRSSAALRSFLSASDRTVPALRKVGLDLVAREQGLRREVAPELLARLERERVLVEARRAEATDDKVRDSLALALRAIDEQRSQRQLLARGADRIEAEVTRLQWTLEGLLAQLVAVNQRGDTAVTPGLEHGLKRVRDELTAVTEALEPVL
jgi:carbonic anhydrase/acetyltransferase-like protein (isoleucine patch superfamily)